MIAIAKFRTLLDQRQNSVVHTRHSLRDTRCDCLLCCRIVGVRHALESGHCEKLSAQIIGYAENTLQLQGAHHVAHGQVEGDHFVIVAATTEFEVDADFEQRDSH